MVVILLGIFTGLLIYTARISNATSYLSDDPKTCINCHVMYPQYYSWMHSSHANVASCNDCHVPQDNVFSTYYFKAMDGLRHASVFTLRLEPQVIQIKQAGINVVQENCKRCHSELVSMVSITEVSGKNAKEGKGHRCWDCHRETPHGTVNSLSSAMHPLVPGLQPVFPALKSKDNKRTEQSSKSK